MSNKKQEEQLKRNEQKWTKPLMNAGWTVIPSVFLERQQALGLDPVDINIILQLARYWWYKEQPPYPSKKAIAECIGRSKSTVRKRIAQMEKDGLISREKRMDSKGQQSNIYRFDGLIKEAQPYAKELIKEREEQRNQTAKRRTRKRLKND